jgi:hypothetical protein
MIGYDIDGVLTRADQFWDLRGAVVISGRTFAEYDDTAKRAAQMCPVYIRGAGTFGDQKHAGEFKAETINRLGVTRFYEDDPVQIAIIRACCPDCEVVQVK